MCSCGQQDTARGVRLALLSKPRSCRFNSLITPDQKSGHNCSAAMASFGLTYRMRRGVGMPSLAFRTPRREKLTWSSKPVLVRVTVSSMLLLAFFISAAALEFSAGLS